MTRHHASLQHTRTFFVGGLSLAVLLGSLTGCRSNGGAPTGAGVGTAPPARNPGAAAPAQGPGAATLPPTVSASALRERAIAVLEAESRHSDASVRANAIEASELAATRLQSLCAAGLRDPAPGVRAVSLMVIGRQRLAGQVAIVEPLLFDQSPFVEASAIFALARNGKAVDQSPLASMVLDHAEIRVRNHAAFVLGELGNSTALLLLKQAGRQPPARATAAERALFELQIAEALVKLGDENALHGIRAALYPARPEDLEATALAVQILGEVKDRGAVDHMIYLSQYRDDAKQRMPAEVRMNIAIALAKMGMREGSFLAREFIQDPSALLRAQAAVAFGYTRGNDNLARLEQLLGDGEARVRVAAAAAILRLQS